MTEASKSTEGVPAEVEPADVVDPEQQVGFTEDDGGSKAGDAATKTLLGFFRLHTFIDLYRRSGDDELPFRGKAAFVIELFIHLLTALLILSIVAVLFWKAIAPVPHFP